MTGSQPKSIVSVIIPHYNGEQILVDCLRSLYRSTAVALEVLLVDNASTDNSVAIVKEQFPGVRIISLQENHGFAGGCNVGIRAASADYVLILNNDTIHAEQWLEKLLDRIKSAPDIAVVQPKLLSYQKQGFFDYSGAAGGEMDVFGFPFARGRIFEFIERDQHQYDEHPPAIFWASGTAFLARKKRLMQAGLFDEHFFAHMEEIDLQWRLHLLGYQIQVVPEAVVWHRSGYTLGAEAPFKKYLNHRNSLLMFLSNYRLLTTCYLLFIRLALDYMALFFSLLRRDGGRAGAILKAHGYILTHPLFIIKKRLKVKKLRVIRDRELMQKLYKGAIPISAFLLGKKSYSDL